MAIKQYSKVITYAYGDTIFAFPSERVTRAKSKWRFGQNPCAPSMGLFSSSHLAIRIVEPMLMQKDVIVYTVENLYILPKDSLGR